MIYDLLIKGGYIVDARNRREGRFDVAVEGGRIARVETEIPPDRARELYDAAGKYVFPGIVDTHVHLTPEKRSIGFGMLARAGVTTVLDCAGPVEEIIKGFAARGAGINVACLNALDPGKTINGPNATRNELAKYLETSLLAGAYGFKLIGGHLPLSPDTTIQAIDLCNREQAYVAFHCGSTQNGSNLEGLLEAIGFAGDNRLQLCHINAYCRGLTHGSAVTETMLALEALMKRPDLVSESHMAPFNGCWARMEDGVPRSHVVRTWLSAEGYTADAAGLTAAARDGYARVQKITPRDVVFLEPDAGAEYLEEVDFQTLVSFPVNRSSTAFLTATEKDAAGRFVVTALSSDGGGIPRNFILSSGLALVRFDALTLMEFVEKAASAPAKMLGLPEKGHLGEGAEADIAVVDPVTHQARLTVSAGRIIMIDDIVTGGGGTLLTTGRARVSPTDSVAVRVVDLSNCEMYRTSE